MDHILFLQKQIEELKPDLVLVTGVLPLDKKIIATVKSQGGCIVNYLTDDPWNPIHQRRSFLANLPDYNHIFSTKQTLQARLKQAGTPSTSWLPFAYDPDLHYPVPREEGADVVFIGTGAQERLHWLNAVAKLPGVQRRIYGNSWEGIKKAITKWLKATFDLPERARKQVDERPTQSLSFSIFIVHLLKGTS